MKVTPALLLLSATLLAPSSAAQHSITYRAAQDGLAPLPVTFEANIPTGATVTWDFGDGHTAQGLKPTHTFYRPGTYRVNVQVRSNAGDAKGTITVQVRDGGPEQAGITLLLTGNTLSFTTDGSRVYAPATPKWTLNGTPVTSGSVLPDGPHVLRLELTSPNGAVSKEVRFNAGALGSSITFESEVQRLTNDARARGWDCTLKRFGGPSKGPLTRNAHLDVAARAQSSAMALHNYFNHTSPLDGSSAGQRARAAGYAWTNVAENIAGGQQTPAEVVTAWLNSPGHCKNIMGDFQEIGISYVSRPGSTLKLYWTQVFGRR